MTVLKVFHLTFIYTSSLIIKEKKAKKERVNLSKLLWTTFTSFENNNNNNEKAKKRDIKERRKKKRIHVSLVTERNKEIGGKREEQEKRKKKKKTFTDHYWLGVERKESTKKERGGIESASSFWRRDMFQFGKVMFMVLLPFLFPSSHTVCNIKTKVKNFKFLFLLF